MVAKTLSRALALLLIAAPAAFGLGLGDIRLLSSLNAPLDAEIELVGATPEELAQLKPQIASRETFVRYGLDYPQFLASVTVQPQKSSDGRNVIKLRSREAITEPFVTLLLEVSWARGKLVREYTVLLDPPVYTPGQASGETAPVEAPVTSEGARGGAISRPAEPSASAQESAPPPPSSESSSPQSNTASSYAPPASGSTRIVRRGDTLSGIASEIAGSDTRSSRKLMVAIYRGNSRAFDGNMNILRSGAELQIPDAAAVDSISTSEASAEIHQQYASWRGAQPATDEPADAGKLRLVPPSADAATPGTGTSTADGDSARVRELEAQLQESRRLIELRNAEVAQLQARLSQKQGTAPPPATDETPVEPAPSATAETPTTAETPSEAPVTEPEPTTAPPEQPTTAETPPVESESGSLLDKAKEFWWVGAALLVIILAMLGMRAYRARQQSEFDDSLGRLARRRNPRNRGHGPDPVDRPRALFPRRRDGHS